MCGLILRTDLAFDHRYERSETAVDDCGHETTSEKECCDKGGQRGGGDRVGPAVRATRHEMITSPHIATYEPARNVNVRVRDGVLAVQAVLVETAV